MPSIINNILAEGAAGSCDSGSSNSTLSIAPTPSPAVHGPCSEDSETQIRVAGYSAAINCLGAPALALSIFLVSDARLGCRKLQLVGFGLMALSLTVFGLVHDRDPCRQSLILGVFCVTFAILNFGTGVTTYLMPARLFPPQVRSTANGISSAAGKAGSAFATTVFPSLTQSESVFIAAAASALGLLVTLACIPQNPGNFDDLDATDRGSVEMPKLGASATPRERAGTGGGGGFSFVGRMEAQQADGGLSQADGRVMASVYGRESAL